jgi:outer membrane protein assembly factor BamB
MVKYSLGDDYEFDNVTVGVSVSENQNLEVEFLLENVRETDNSVIFKIGIGGSVLTRPIIKDNVVYFGACDRNVYAIGLKNGEEIWRFPTGGPVTSSVAIDNGRIYVGSYDGNLYALSMKGDLVWKFNAGNKIASAPAVHDSNIYFGCKDGNLYAVGRNGNLLWKFRTNGPIGSPVIIYKDIIYVGSFDYNIYSIGLDGRLIWKFAARDQVGGPHVNDDVVYFGSFDQCVYALDTNGKFLWRFGTNDAIPIGTNLAAKNDTLYFGSRDNNLYAVKGGNLVWKFKTNNMIFSKPIIEDGKVYFCSSDGNLYAVDGETGKESWKFTVGSPVMFPEKSGDIICFGCYDCNLYAVNTEGELLWKFPTSMSFPANIDFTPEIEHTVFVPVTEHEIERGIEEEKEERRLTVYGDFNGNYIENDMKDYTGLPIKDGGARLLYKNKKMVYQK